MMETNQGEEERGNDMGNELKAVKASSPYYLFSSKIFLRYINGHPSNLGSNIQDALDKAQLNKKWGEYESFSIFNSLLGAIFFLALFIIMFSLRKAIVVDLIFISLIPISAISFFIASIWYPFYESSLRRKSIEQDLGPALTFISAMAGADVPVNLIFDELAKREEYGEVQYEALRISKFTGLLGYDIFSAMQEVSRSSPSVEWQRFLQGAVSTAYAGGKLKPYFIGKAVDYQNKLRVSLKKNIESVAIFAEIYVAVGVAFPLFLVVIVAVLGTVTRPVSFTSTYFLILFSFVAVPIMIASFLLLIRSVTREVSIS